MYTICWNWKWSDYFMNVTVLSWVPVEVLIRHNNARILLIPTTHRMFVIRSMGVSVPQNKLARCFLMFLFHRCRKLWKTVQGNSGNWIAKRQSCNLYWLCVTPNPLLLSSHRAYLCNLSFIINLNRNSIWYSTCVYTCHKNYLRNELFSESVDY